MIHALAAKPPVFEEARRLIRELLEVCEEDRDTKLNLLLMKFVPEYPINARECEDCEQDIVCTQECPRYTLEWLPQICQFFVDEGWDSHRYGLNLLVALLYTTDTKVVLNIARQVCEDGFDADDVSREHLLRSIAETESYIRLHDRNDDSAADLQKVYDLVLHVRTRNHSSEMRRNL